MTSLELAKAIIRILDDKKAVSISAIQVEELTVLSEYFIIATGTSDRHVRTLSDAVGKEIKEKFGVLPHHVEGFESLLWVLLDYNGVVVHLFQGETRELYDLERLWGDAPRLDLKDLVKE